MLIICAEFFGNLGVSGFISRLGCAWNTFFARLSPTVTISDMTLVLYGSSKAHLGTLMPSGDGHIIRAPKVTKYVQDLIWAVDQQKNEM